MDYTKHHPFKLVTSPLGDSIGITREQLNAGYQRISWDVKNTLDQFILSNFELFVEYYAEEWDGKDLPPEHTELASEIMQDLYVLYIEQDDLYLTTL